MKEDAFIMPTDVTKYLRQTFLFKHDNIIIPGTVCQLYVFFPNKRLLSLTESLDLSKISSVITGVIITSLSFI